MANDFGELWRELEDPATVTLTIPQTRTEAELSYVITDVLVRQTRQEDVIRGDQFIDGYWCTFHLWEDKLLSVIPKKGMKITDSAGDVYEIEEVKHLSRRQRFECLGMRVRG